MTESALLAEPVIGVHSGRNREAPLWNPYALSARLILNCDNELRIFQRSPAGSKTETERKRWHLLSREPDGGRAGTPRSTFGMPGSRQRNLS